MQSPYSPIPNRVEPQTDDEKPDNQKKKEGPIDGISLMRVAFIITMACIAFVIVTSGAEIITNFSQWLLKLHRYASINPNNSRGFGNFVQLILIAVFVGWTINRFKNKGKDE